MDLIVLARKLALAFANGESSAGLAAAVQAHFPSAAYVSLCVRGSNDIAVATSNLVAGGFMTTSLMGTRYCPCLVSERPELVPVGMSTLFMPLAGRLLAGRFLCIPIPTMPPAPPPNCEQISALVEQPGGMLGCLILGLAAERPVDPNLISNTANLVRGLMAELPGAAVRAAASIVSFQVPVSLADAAAASSDASQPQFETADGRSQMLATGAGSATAADIVQDGGTATTAAAPVPQRLAEANLVAGAAVAAPHGAAAAVHEAASGSGGSGSGSSRLDSTACIVGTAAAALCKPSAGAACSGACQDGLPASMRHRRRVALSQPIQRLEPSLHR